MSKVGQANKVHGLSNTKEYRTWRSMKDRCYNKRHISYPQYGGRGITVCARWKQSFLNFWNDMGPAPTLELSLDRVDNDGPYSPENCEWSTRLEQARNRSPYRKGRILSVLALKGLSEIKVHLIKAGTLTTLWRQSLDLATGWIERKRGYKRKEKPNGTKDKEAIPTASRAEARTKEKKARIS